MSDPTDTPPEPTGPDAPVQQALQGALQRLLGTLGGLAVAQGLPYAQAEEMLKQAFVDAASAAHPTLPAHRKVSRISTATGINRREVTRLTAAAAGRTEARSAARSGSLVGEVFTRWRTHAEFREPDGQPRKLPRQGATVSFETLAQGVTRDVHPRSLLEEMCRLGLVLWDEAADTVELVRPGQVPRGDKARLFNILGANVGDHLAAAAANVLAAERPPHLEQALFARGLSTESIESLQPQLRAQWDRLRETLVPLLEALIEADSRARRTADQRFRLGLFTYHETSAAPAVPKPAPAAKRKPPT